MIFISRDPSQKPEGFDELAAELLADFHDKQAADPSLTASKYWSNNRKKIADAASRLSSIFYNKCAFCESNPTDTSYLHIEHYRPKSIPEFTDLMFEWDNFLISCQKCNHKKDIHFPMTDGVPDIINPCIDEPSIHLFFENGNIKSYTERGRKTIKFISLDRKELNRSRSLHLVSIKLSLIQYINNPYCDPIYLSILSWAIQPQTQWSACARAQILTRLSQAILDEHFSSDSYQDPVTALDLLTAQLQPDQDAFW